LSADWIEGRFEGIYSGPRRPRVEKRARREKGQRVHVSSELRRFGFEIESGQLRDFTICDAPDPETIDSDRVIRQDRVKHVRLSEADDDERETSLFDVHISDWQLKHPAEADDRAYGTIVGTLRARRRPALARPAAQDEAATISYEPLRKDVESASSIPKRVFNQSVDSADPADMEAGLGWAQIVLLLAIVFAGIGYACGLRSAVVWLAPIALAVGLLWLAGDGLVRGASGWLTGVLPALQVFILWPSLELAWQSDCWPVLGTGQLALLAGPVVLSAILGSRGPLWTTGMIWTAVLCSSCASNDVFLCTAASGGDAPAPAETRTENRPPRRTDEHGRWPVMPPISVPSVAPGPGLSSGSRPAESPDPEANSSAIHQANHESGTITLIAPGATSESASRAVPTTAATPGTPDLAAGVVGVSQPAPTTPNARQRASREPVTNGVRRVNEVGGGWLSPEHRRAPREHVLISIEQANRTPALFFDSGGAHRVYVPTDPIFEDGSSTPRHHAPLVLARVAALLSLSSHPPVLLEVHSDSAGAQENQIELSQRRADRVRSWLVDRGHVSPSRFEMRAIGGGHPLVPPDGDYGAQQPNRRIEIRLLEEK
jgi:outer membrane protein OmpA-like peptidoglycan-associated protein